MPKAASKVKDTKKTTGKSKKDPNAPKRPLSSYMFFCADMREKIKTEKPDMKITELTQEIGKRWKAMSEGDKKKYIGQAEQDKKRYADEMSGYKPSAAGQDESSKKKKGGSKPKPREKSESEDEQDPSSEDQDEDE